MAGHDPLSRSTRATKRTLILVSFLALLESFKLIHIDKIPFVQASLADHSYVVPLILSLLLIPLWLSAYFQLQEDWANRAQPAKFHENLKVWKSNIWQRNKEKISKLLKPSSNASNAIESRSDYKESFYTSLLSSIQTTFVEFRMDPTPEQLFKTFKTQTLQQVIGIPGLQRLKNSEIVDNPEATFEKISEILCHEYQKSIPVSYSTFNRSQKLRKMSEIIFPLYFGPAALVLVWQSFLIPKSYASAIVIFILVFVLVKKYLAMKDLY